VTAIWIRCWSFIDIIPVPLTESLGTVTGKYPAKDKITSSAVDLLGEESIQRLLHITDTNNPYRFDLRRGALARVAGGGIHFADEIYQKQERSGPGLPGGHPEPHHRNRRLSNGPSTP
jgi:serine protein kinase